MNIPSLFRGPSSILPSVARTFTSTAALSNKKRNGWKPPQNIVARIPPYPYGPARIYKQSDKGLYAGKRIQFGNKVSDHNNKTRRVWKVNVLRQDIYSEALNKNIRLRVTQKALRTIDKCGGLDNYLLGNKTRRIKELGLTGWNLRWRIMQTPMVKERLRQEEIRLGLREGERPVGHQTVHQPGRPAKPQTDDDRELRKSDERNKMLMKRKERMLQESTSTGFPAGGDAA